MNKINSKDFSEALLKKQPVVTMFYTSYCMFCKKFHPIFKKYENANKYELAQVDITDDNDPLWDKFSIKNVPTIIVFKGNKILGRSDAEPGVGITEDKYKNLLNII